MKIISLVENTTKKDFKTAHGLSLYIETGLHKILFDVGPDETLFENTEKLKVNLEDVDTVIISHGHYDHGGALEKFLKVNSKAKIWAQKDAFYKKHFSGNREKDIGLKEELAESPRFMLLEGGVRIDDELEIFTINDSSKCHSEANDCLYEEDKQDKFNHEQYLLIHGERPVLVLGCGHKGIVNIMDAAQKYKPAYCVGGYHLFNPNTNVTIPDNVLEEIAQNMKGIEGIQYYTCHCTGTKAYAYLKERLDNINYLACGDELMI